MNKFFRKSVLSLFVGILLLPNLEVSAQQELQITEHKLANGLTVILNEDHTKPEVFGVVGVRAGGKNDPSDATGLAHYMEHMLFKGTQTLGTTDWEKEKVHIDKIFELYDKLGKTTSEEERNAIQQEISEESYLASEFAIPNELSSLINQMGGTNLNAATGPDYTLYFNRFPASQIYKWLDLYAHRFVNPVFRGFQAELEVVYEEKNMYSDMFVQNILEEFQKVFFKNHPYGQQPLIGTIEHLKNPSLNRMLEFYETYYVANNMVLVLSGDFNTQEVMPIIEEKFGVWPTGDVPEPKVFAEEPFQGREFYEMRLSPVKVGLLGFRTVPSQHEDAIALEVASSLLNNSSETGLLDKLMQDGEVMAAQVLQMPYNDHGATIVLIIPKVVGQKTVKAENLVLAQMNKLAQGDFDEEELDAVKKSLYVTFKQSMESVYQRATLLTGAFTSSIEVDDLLAYPDKVMAVTKEDVIRVAKTYFGDNYLAFHSKMGFPKKEKIEKPNFKALQSNTNAKSVYTTHYETIKSRPVQIVPVDFHKDITSKTIAKGVELRHVNNPCNDIFTLTIQYQVGNYHLKFLEEAAGLMTLAGTESRSVDELKKEFAKLGCNYSIWSSDSYTNIRVEGVEEAMPQALALLNELITTPVIDKKRITVLYNVERTNRKMEKTEPSEVGYALRGHMLYGEKSDYLDRLTLKELKGLQPENATKVFKEAMQHRAIIHYVGNVNPDEVQSLIAQNFSFAESPKVVEIPVVRPTRQIDDNTIYFVNMKKARQSQIHFYAQGGSYTKSLDPKLELFNEYFNGGFNGLVLQEIREYRSLAYGASGYFTTPSIKDKPYRFTGSLSTQSDKTITAIETYDSLIRTMPEKPERLNAIKEYLMLSAETNRPNFRYLSTTVEGWKLRGYTEDPFVFLKPAYEKLTWSDLMDFYTENLKAKPMSISIVGDKRNIDMKELQRYGKIQEMKAKQLISK